MEDSPIKASVSEIQDDIASIQSQLENSDEPFDPVRQRELEHILRALEVRLEKKHREDYEEDMRFLDNNEIGSFSKTLAIPTPGQHQRPQSSPVNANRAGGFAAYAGSTRDRFGGSFASDGALADQGRAAAVPSWNSSVLDEDFHDTTAANEFALPETGTPSGSASSPDRLSSISSPTLPTMTHVPQKRQRQSLTLPHSSSGRGAKSIRTTPSPAMTGASTPSSSLDSFEMPDDQEFFRLMGGNPKDHLRDMREEQKDQEKALKEKREQEQRDEEYARGLEEQELAQVRSSAGTSSRAQIPLSSFGSQALSQTMLDTQGRFQRPELRQNSFENQSSLHIRPDSVDHSFTTSPTVKHERSQVRSETPSLLQSNFIDLGSEDESETVAGDPSSDLVEIDPNTFHSNGSISRPYRSLPWSKNGSAKHDRASVNSSTRRGSWIDIGQDDPSDVFPSSHHTSHMPPPNRYANPYQGVTGYGSNNLANPITGAYSNLLPSPSWHDTASRLGQGFVDTAKGVYNSAYGLLDQRIGSYPNAAPEFNNTSYPYGLAGSSTNSHFISNTPALDYYGQQHQRSVASTLSKHSINPHDPNNKELFDRYMERVDYLTHDPTRTSAEIKSLLENIRPDEDLPPENREGTPEAMTFPLFEHQKLGLAWMKSMEEGSNKGGILADDMGLGKTVQALALLVSRKSNDPTRKTTLIVAPVALMKQWEREIKTKIRSEHRLTTYVLHGSNRDTTWDKLRTYDVVLTTFGTLATELKRKEGIDMKKRANPNWRPISKADQLPLLGDDCMWYRVIVDEAQCIKNKSTKAALGASSLHALTRFCMSGTPMMNHPGELFSLIHFLRIKPYNEVERFNREITKPLMKGHSEHAKKQAMQRLQTLLKAVSLRRTKISTIDGKPILTLPERTNTVQHAAFSEDESSFYHALETKTQLQFNKYLKAQSVGRNYSNVLVLLLRLRQACCHPHLIQDFGVSSGVTDVSVQNMIALAKELTPDVVARIIEQGALECPVCMDSAENATIFTPCGHSTCSECFAKLSDPSQAIADGQIAEGRNSNDIKCPSCRTKVVPSKVLDYNSFKRVHMPEEADAEGLETLIVDADGEAADSDSDDSDEDDSDEKDDLDGFVVADDAHDDETTSEDEEHEGYRKGANPFERCSVQSSKVKSQKNSDKGKGKAKENKASRKTLAELKKEGTRNAKARRKYLKRLEREWIPSTKIEKTIEILEAIQGRKEGEKTIIFSQFTSLLDLLEIPIVRRQWGYRRYDGSMSSHARNEAVIEFTDKPECSIMLVSLKAGNSGLNLVAASQVIIFDPFWNPYIEEQAIDRAHRIGQLRPVQVHRILVPETVEDRIVALQDKKRALIEGALDEKASQSIGRLGTKELTYLMGL
ncbi:hypothetical protein MMC12_001378 [Toensbergia leucococca]|nr:hypothetical protein [Toensbergia leucococca]